MTVLRGLAAAAALLFASAAAAQERVLGTVTEAGTGAPVAGARIQAGGATASSDGAGGWSLMLPAGVHAVEVRHPGYAAVRTEVAVPADGSVRIALTPRPLRMETMVATASRRLQTLGEAPVATEVVDRARIEAGGATDLAGVLAMVPGVEVQGGHPVGTGVYLQGLGSERVLVLIDGEPVVGRISGEIDLTRLPVADVERVEVVKGPQSTLYGSEAMGGVINLITRAPQPGAPAGGVQLTGGSSGRRDGVAHARASAGAVDWTARGGLRDVDLVPGQDRPLDAGTRRWDGSARVGWRAAPALRVEAGGWLVEESQRWRTGQLYQFADNRQWSGRLSAAWTAGAHRLVPSLYLAGFEHALSRASGPVPVDGGDREVQRLAEAALAYTGTVRGLTVDGGAELRQDWTRSDRVEGEERDATALDAYGQGTWTAGAVSLVPGVRLSHSSRWGDHWTPRLAAVWRPAPSLAVRASAGAGYRAPAFKELHMDFLNDAAGYTVRGNPALRPEDSFSVSAGAEWAGQRTYLRASAFRTRFDDFIETVVDTAVSTPELAVYRYQNVARGRTAGLELQTGAVLGGLRADAGWSWLATRDEASGRPLFGRPAHSGRLALAYARASGLRVGLTASYTGRTPEAEGQGVLLYRASYTRLDGRLSHTLPAGLALAVGMDNLTGAGPAGWPGFTGRNLYATLSWTAGERNSCTSRTPPGEWERCRSVPPPRRCCWPPFRRWPPRRADRWARSSWPTAATAAGTTRCAPSPARCARAGPWK
ncbi:TonB-dependent receptor [Longimicrobium sp.]|uniref:TonB-dependent receptor n=1 Tax=Longimicrobium sp. TaxID=2029185 RepID=UPI003B3B1BF0